MSEAKFARRAVRRPDGTATLTVFLPDGPLTVPGNHPNFEDLLEAVDAGATLDEIQALGDVATAVATKLESLSERVSVDIPNGIVYFDGDQVHDALAAHILRALEGDGDFKPLVSFWEKLAQNPNEHSREQLYEWLARNDFSIAPDGDFYAYKGCAVDDTGTAVSVNRGKAVVDGKPVNGAVPNPIGAVVEFPRSEVDFNPSVGCSRGLHVGSYAYAQGWARGVLLLAKVNPRDVVSVPTDCDYAKVRTARYEVVDTYTQAAPISAAVYDTEDPDDYRDEDEDEGWSL